MKANMNELSEINRSDCFDAQSSASSKMFHELADDLGKRNCSTTAGAAEYLGRLTIVDLEHGNHHHHHHHHERGSQLTPMPHDGPPEPAQPPQANGDSVSAGTPPPGVTRESEGHAVGYESPPATTVEEKGKAVGGKKPPEAGAPHGRKDGDSGHHQIVAIPGC